MYRYSYINITADSYRFKDQIAAADNFSSHKKTKKKSTDAHALTRTRVYVLSK